MYKIVLESIHDTAADKRLPRLYHEGIRSGALYRNYFQTYVERDLRQLINVKDLSRFETFLRLVAGRVGQVLNMASLGNDVGISGNTVRDWLLVLESSFVLFRLPSHAENLGKRLVKSPKLYFIEPGLAAYLLQIETPAQVARDPLLGGLFENFVLSELLKNSHNRGLDPRLSFFRDNNGREVDVILEKSRVPIPLEIKAARTMSESFLASLRFFRKLSGTPAPGYVIYGGDISQEREDVFVLPFTETGRIFEQ